jgi:hypothetical protein
MVKKFKQYHLVSNYRVGKQVKQNYHLYIGYEKLLDDEKNRRIFAKLLENKINGNVPISEEMLGASKELLDMANKYYQMYLYKMRSDAEKQKEEEENEARFESVDLGSTKIVDCREIGAESMSKKMLDMIGFREFLEKKGWKLKERIGRIKERNMTITMQSCSQLTMEAMTIYRALNMSSMPLPPTKFVVYHGQPPSKE